MKYRSEQDVVQLRIGSLRYHDGERHENVAF